MRKPRVLRKVLIVASVLVVGSASYVRVKYRDMYSPADPMALAAMISDERVTVETDQWIRFAPAAESPSTGIVFYPGGLVDERGYAEPLRAIAQAGYLAVLVPMPLDLAVLSPNKALRVIRAHPDVEKWVVAGHSLGGAMAAQFAEENDSLLAGLLFFDAYPPEAVDLRDFEGLVGWMYRADAEGKMPAYYEAHSPRMPQDVTHYPIPDGTHINFGRFIPAERFRNAPASALGVDEQFALIGAAAADFMARVDSR